MNGSEFLSQVMEAKRHNMYAVTDEQRQSVRDRAQQRRCSGELQFSNALRSHETAIIAEFKRRSPSAGAIRGGADPVLVAKLYEASGAAAMSVLTEPDHFEGSLADLQNVSQAVQLPLLRKDFVVDEHQIWEAAAYGASAILLIVAGLSDHDTEHLLDVAHEARVDALVEVHTVEEMDRALSLGAELVGVNNRNLKTLNTDLQTSFDLARIAPEGITMVAESGLRTREDIERLQEAGYTAFLIGETLMRAEDPGVAVRELLGEKVAR